MSLVSNELNRSSIRFQNWEILTFSWDCASRHLKWVPLALSRFIFKRNHLLRFFSVWTDQISENMHNPSPNTPWVLIISTRKFNGSCSTLRAHRSGIVFLLIQASVVVAERRQNFKVHISNIFGEVILFLQPSFVIPYASIVFMDFWATWWFCWCCGCEQPPFLS